MKIYLLVLLAACCAETPPPAGPESASLYTSTFAQKAGEKIDLGQIDSDLLSAAIFHETNKRRQIEGLPPMLDQPQLRAAARMQADIMAERGSVSHVNPGLLGKETVADRFLLAGLTPGFSAENVATAFGLRYRAGEPLYTREVNGKKLFSREKNGDPIEMHTYLSLAESVLNQWMASPEHRANIVSNARFLGAGCQVATNGHGMPVFYCAQTFYTPPK
ncbi:MAG: hypothetical protein JWL90_1603 [Chthoniobacteraceae bacterium]|nr:hypothetical protein [Chthoniobacteraceae bacterium]